MTGRARLAKAVGLFRARGVKIAPPQLRLGARQVPVQSTRGGLAPLAPPTRAAMHTQMVARCDATGAKLTVSKCPPWLFACTCDTHPRALAVETPCFKVPVLVFRLHLLVKAGEIPTP